MTAKAPSTSSIVTRSQTKNNTASASDLCVCPPLQQQQQISSIMNEDQKQEFKALFTDLMKNLRADIEKESYTHRTQLDSLQTTIDKKSSAHGLKPDFFDGNPISDALAWLDAFGRLAKINNWSDDLQLNALPLHLKGVAQAWFLALPEDVTSDLNKLKAAFNERFASGPQDWILSQKLSARKHTKGESIDDYVADITRLTKRLKLSDKESMRYLVEGLQPDIQAYVSLNRPKSFQEAESLARMKDIVNQRQGVSDSQSLLTQMQAMFNKFMVTSAENTKTIAAVATTPPTSPSDKRIDDLTKQVKQLQKEQRQEAAASAMAAYDQPTGSPRPFQARNWQGQPNRQMEQLQRQVARLQQDLQRYQNPRRADFRSYGRSFRSIEGDPICSFCKKIGHSWRVCRQRNRDPRLPVTTPTGQSRPEYSRPPGNRSYNPQLNG